MARSNSTSVTARAFETSAKRAAGASRSPRLRVASDEPPPTSREGGVGGAGRVTAAGSALPVTWERVAIDLIDIPSDRLRKVDMAWAEVVGRSMAQDGQQQPVRLVLEETGRYTVAIGAHRVIGAGIAGLDEVEAGWVHRDWADASSSRIPEIIENLIRNELDALGRAHHLAEYQAIFSALHPNSGHGGDRRSEARRDQVAKLATWSFSDEAADKTGLSERAVRRALQIWHGLDAGVRETIADTALARNQATLLALAVLEAKLQARVVALLLSGEAASVGDAVLIAQGKRPMAAPEKLFKSVSSGLGRLNARSRATLWETYEDEILAAFRKKGIVK